jgi:hypothetical protein
MRRRPETGSALIAGVFAIGLLLVLFLGALSMVVEEYLKGALRAAVDEAAQAGATAGGSLISCELKGAQVSADLIPGPFERGVVINCRVQGNLMVASFAGDVHGLIAPVPPLHMSVLGFSVIEAVPAQ